jgi:hypothetical protein
MTKELTKYDNYNNLSERVLNLPSGSPEAMTDIL